MMHASFQDLPISRHNVSAKNGCCKMEKNVFINSQDISEVAKLLSEITT